MNKKTIFAVAIILSVIMLTTPTDSISTVNTQPATEKVNIDGIINIYLNVTPGTNISGMQTNIKFDPTVIRIDSVHEGELFNKNNHSTFFNSGTIDNVNGEVTNIFNVILGRYSTNSTGTFINIQGTPLKKGISKIELNNIKIAQQNGTPEPLIWTNSTITIEAASYDVNQDGIVDISDLVIVASHFGESTHERWNADGTPPVDIYDIVHITRHW